MPVVAMLPLLQKTMASLVTCLLLPWLQKTFEQFTGKYGIKTPFTTFLGVLSAIPRRWRGLLYTMSSQGNGLDEPDKHKIDNLLS